MFKHDGSLVNDVEKLNCNVDSNALGKPKEHINFIGETGEQLLKNNSLLVVGELYHKNEKV